ncbi:hypothetical protein ATCC90586_004393 [Pythium insidiosum]|nr:hypothetical protein ATCC90586_004393 [Pythium insidiosum]
MRRHVFVGTSAALWLSISVAASETAVAVASSMSSLPAFDIPSFDYASLLQGETPQRLLQALQTDGMMTLLPAYQRMLQDNTVSFRDQANATTRYLLEPRDDSSPMPVGAASGRRLEASDGTYRDSIEPAPTPSPTSAVTTKATVNMVIIALAALVALLVIVLSIVIAPYVSKDARSSTHEMTAGVSTKTSSPRLTESSPRLTLAERELSLVFCDAGVLALRLPMQRLAVGDEISHGAFGRVYEGVYDQQQVAIKRLSPQFRSNRRHVLAFLGEAKLMSTMCHERIIRFVGIAWTSPTDLMVVTAFMAGGDLRSLVMQYADRSLPTGFNQDKLRIAVHVIEGLAYMHSLQPPVLHRDLKSRNILLSDSLDACLTDFGVSRERSDVTMTMGVGTLRWMAPEVMQGGRYTDTADVFSFGVVLSELDTHQLPYSVEGRNMPDAAVITQISLGRLRVSFSPLADEEIVALARQCMALSPEDRPSAMEVMHSLRRIHKRHLRSLPSQTFEI